MYGEHNRAIQLLRSGLDLLIAAGEIPGEMLLSCVYIIGVVLERSGDYTLPQVVYSMLLKHIEELFDSKSDQDSSPLFEVELHHRLMKLASITGDIDTAQLHSKQLETLLPVFDMELESLLVLGRETVEDFLQQKNLSGIRLNYVSELKNLSLHLSLLNTLLFFLFSFSFF